MRYIEETTDFQLKNSVVTLGKFDGLHMGHQLLLSEVLARKEEGYQTAMFTFSLHPYNLFSEKEVKLIYTNEEKVYKLKEIGLDVLIAYPFTKETASLEPEEFIKQVLVEKCDAKILVVGDDFCFGKDRKGNVSLLKEYADVYGYQVIALDKIQYHNHVVSSTRVREELQKGNMEEVNAMLLQPFFIRGEVVHGHKLGRTLGVPTINIIPPESKLLPPNGVYASQVCVDGNTYHGVTNIGYKPTIGGEVSLGVETYIFDYEGDLYERVVQVSLHHYIRPEMRFADLTQLKEQINHDMKQAKAYFEKNKVDCK